MDVEILRGLSAFNGLEEEWNQMLPHSSFNSAFGTFEWFHTWARHFAAPSSVLLVVARRKGHLQGILPLLKEKRHKGRWSWIVLRSMANLQTVKYGFLLRREGSVDVLKPMLERLSQEVPWSFMELEFVPASARWPDSLIQGSHPHVAGVRREVQMESPFLLLEGDWDVYLSARKKKVRRNWRYFEKRLRKAGDLEFESLEGGECLEDAIQEAFRIEEKGWKGDEGTAIANSPRESAFCLELAQRAARENRLRLFFLKLDGQRIAFDCCLQHAGRFSVLKTGYDPDYAKFSPGRILRVFAVREFFGHPEQRLYDFLGARDGWKEEWTDDNAEPLFRLLLYRNSPAPRARYRVLSALDRSKEALRRHPRLFQAAKSLAGGIKALGRRLPGRKHSS
jgi:CelD/BcsL family acetyltransferase involved in cellulose biosynthesis